jgi:hypothetical protein
VRLAQGTEAVPLSLVHNPDVGVRRSLCPACKWGHLHPYRLSVDLGGYQGMSHGTAWVAVCVGSHPARDMVDEPSPPCGFTVRLDPVPERRGGGDR